MRIPKYWARGSYEGRDLQGEQRTFSAWGWSFRSRADAEHEAAKRAERIFHAFSEKRTPGRYDYLDAPLREEILSEHNPGQETAALITRNRYGAWVLNTAKVCFADVDLPALEPKGWMDRIILALNPGEREKRYAVLARQTLDTLRQWAADKRHSFRLYRTRAGFRILFTDGFYDPCSAQVQDLLQSLGGDPLYSRLTRKQECFRARLTPKPWRIKCPKPPGRYPRLDAPAQETFERWLKQYEKQCSGFKVCELVESFGSPKTADQIGQVVQLHDRYACGEGALA